MLIGGLERFSLIDFPNCLAAVIFTKGCNFRCSFCYNPMLVCQSGSNKDINKAEKEQEQGRSRQIKENNYPLIDEGGLFQFLESRVGKLDGVVITGGEPTIQPDLPEFIEKIKKMGYLVKLDTNGSNPEKLQKLIDMKLIDYIAMDLKADKDNYEKTIQKEIDFKKIEESVKIIKESGLPYEFRTTCVPGFIDEKIIENMGKLLEGAEKWYLQKFKSDTDLIDKNLVNKKSFTLKEMEEFKKIGEKYVKKCEIR